jgi:MoxR-vWA-beta-propeller ternary system domain bpX2
MAKDPSNSLKEFWAEIPRADEDFLGSIRDWKNVQIALEEDVVWLKGFTDEQAVSSEIQQLPNFLLYELRDGLLFRKEALVPSKKMRTALLWTPIDKALRLKFPISNNNFFGIDGKIEVKLKPSEEEHPATVLLCSIAEIKDVMITLPKFKLEKINWIVVGNKALFTGIPLLSFPGKTFWEKDGHFLPTGFDFEFKNLSVLLQKKYNECDEKWLLWNENGNVLHLNKDDFRKLSVSSFRLTEKSLEWM